MNASLHQYQALLQRYLGPLRTKVFLLTGLLFGGIALQLLTPQLVGRFIDTAQANGPTADLLRTAAIYLVAALLGQVVRTAAAYATEDVKWRATNHMRGDLADHCLNLDMSFHNTHTPGSMIERIDGDVNELSNFFSQFIIQIMGNGLLLVGVLALLLREDWRIGGGFTLYAILAFLLISRTVSIAVPYWKAWREARSNLFGFLEERLAGAEDIRANGGVAYVMNGLHRAIYEIYRCSRKAFVIGDLLWSGTHALFTTGALLALGLSGYLYLSGDLSIGAVYLVFHYSSMLNRPIDILARQIKDLQSATASIERIQELFDTRPGVQDPPPDQARPLPAGPLGIRFEGVHFAYQPNEPVLQAITFDLQPGEVLGLLGRTGSGKTTLTRLLFRLYDPQAGLIRLGDVPLSEAPLADLRRRVGIVTQEVQLFQATVRDNLTFFDPTISDDQILAVLHDLGLGAWYERLPEGLDTRLAAGHGGLSAGEGQLLAFARIFLKDPGLVILDEASSRLDPATEQLIERAIDRLFHRRSAIIVAHRLATVQRADKIMILENGRVQEFGQRIQLAADPNSRFAALLRTGLEEVLA